MTVGQPRDSTPGFGGLLYIQHNLTSVWPWGDWVTRVSLLACSGLYLSIAWEEEALSNCATLKAKAVPKTWLLSVFSFWVLPPSGSGISITQWMCVISIHDTTNLQNVMSCGPVKWRNLVTKLISKASNLEESEFSGCWVVWLCHVFGLCPICFEVNLAFYYEIIFTVQSRRFSAHNLLKDVFEKVCLRQLFPSQCSLSLSTSHGFHSFRLPGLDF